MALKEFLREKKWKKMKKDQWLILFLAGVLLLIVAMPAGKSSSKTAKQKNAQEEIAQANGTESGEADYEKTLEIRLAQILEGMDGVGNVQVMLTFQDQGESVVEKDVTMRQNAGTGSSGQDSGGGTTGSFGMGNSGSRESSESTVFLQSDGDETPFVNKEILPKIDGVLIVAEGGADASVRKNVSEAVEALFGLDAHKIKIVKMKTKGDSN
ncbi:stage III sporulation protein AG [uncultured Eubacterium sp.]|uniref:stage III sporulation protein AG n=1 Tax=uncultured Eubacterium sp. TaxID=165185 RepID=UPI0025CB9E38|nr:stage III sporulation protein AG [uncultured Eubacterium sp.]